MLLKYANILKKNMANTSFSIKYVIAQNSCTSPEFTYKLLIKFKIVNNISKIDENQNRLFS